MKKPNSSTPRKAAAARANGRKGRGPKNSNFSRWNALGHALTAVRLGILEGNHLPEYGVYAALHAQLVRLLSPLSVEDLIAIDKFIVDAWRLRRAFRFELSETEKPDNGMVSPGMSNILRYSNSANRQFAESYARIKEICKRKQASTAAQLAAAAARDLDGEQEPPSQPAAVPALPQAAAVNVESLDSASIKCNPEDEVECEQPTQSASPTTTPSASAQHGDARHGTPEEDVHPAAAAEAAQSAPSPTAASSTMVSEEGESPGEG
jgi:hypothetical protein